MGMDKERTWENRIQAVGRFCFWLGLVLELLIMLVDTSAYTNPIEGQLFRVTFLLFALKVACSKFTLKEWLCLAFFMVIAGLCYLFSARD